MTEYKLVDTGKKSKYLGFRVEETVYKTLENLASETGGTVSATARQLILKSLDNRQDPILGEVDKLLLSNPGGYKDVSSSSAVFIVKENTTQEELDRTKKMAEKLLGLKKRSKR